ncbi:alginate export family protein [Sphingomonas lycopersici]|uniref:Alginate export domain-containing protein n=1 Tax=Sphingomonas lycopersici TaxID=2951807 RepID=A0AA42CSS8_9SPHN|nr:hypothetical protein [Sphingomonas lycopersici]MCW6537617.1 hypothetical protein [Sphingomonas lycopersici]
MRAPLLLLLAGVTSAPAAAQTLTLTPLAEARLRYEQVSQTGLPEDADAVTIRLRAGVQAALGNWSALAQAQGNLAVVSDYDDGLHGISRRPLVADPQNIALYRAQLRYKTDHLAIAAGRQAIVLDDERFIGSVNFRQNGQTFDAVRAEISPIRGIKADVSYAWDVRTVWGVDGNGARPASIGGNYVLANLSAATPIGTLTGFGYLVDEDQATVQGYRLSSQTYGSRLAGSRRLAKAAKLAWQLSYARQSGYGRNPNHYAADYWLADLKLDLNGPQLGGGYELLGAGNGAALTSFQTPLATTFKFQGWAGKFLTTPPDGVRDLYVDAGYGWAAIGPIKAVALQAVWHHFESDRLVRHYGNEIDVVASGKLGKTTASIRYASYTADHFATDTHKFWLQLDWMI